MSNLMDQLKALDEAEAQAIRNLSAAMQSGADMPRIIHLTNEMEDLHNQKMLLLKQIRSGG